MNLRTYLELMNYRRGKSSKNRLRLTRTELVFIVLSIVGSALMLYLALYGLCKILPKMDAAGESANRIAALECAECELFVSGGGE